MGCAGWQQAALDRTGHPHARGHVQVRMCSIARAHVSTCMRAQATAASRSAGSSGGGLIERIWAEFGGDLNWAAAPLLLLCALLSLLCRLPGLVKLSLQRIDGSHARHARSHACE